MPKSHEHFLTKGRPPPPPLVRKRILPRLEFFKCISRLFFKIVVVLFAKGKTIEKLLNEGNRRTIVVLFISENCLIRV